MRYLISTVHDRPEPPSETVPAALHEAMGNLVSKLAADGVLVDAAGLAGIDQAKRVDLHEGAIKVIDGPFAETKEWVGGYFIIQVRSEAEAVEIARQSAEVHQKHFPGFDIVHEVRRIEDGDD